MNVVPRIIAALVAMTPAAALAQDACAPGEEELKFSIVTAVQGHPKGEAALAFADALNERFDGRYCVKIYGNAELFDDDDALYDAMLAGEVTFAAPALDKLSRFTTKMSLFSLPFLFDSSLHALEFQDSAAAQSLTNDFADDGMYAFGFWANGMRQMSATVPIRSPRDAEGLTFRVSSDSPLTAAMFETMGVNSVQMSFSKVYDALKSGEVQGQENTWSNIETQRFYEVQAAVTETNHSYLGYVTMTTLRFLDGLSAEDRQFVIDTMKLITHERNRFAFELNEVSRQAIVEDGGVIITLSDAELAAFREAFRPVFDIFKEEIGADLVDAAIEINANANPF